MTADCPFKVGDVIIEKHPQASERVIRHIVEGQGISCTGVATGRATRIAWKNVRRYELAAWPFNQERQS